MSAINTMNPAAIATRTGLHRGWIEFRQTMTNPGELLGWTWPSILGLIVLVALRGTTVPGTDFPLGSQSVPGLLGMNVVMSGMLGLTAGLTIEREDGTLLRMKAVPNGMVGYLIGKVVGQVAMTVGVLFLVLIPCALLFDGLALGRLESWLTLAWVLPLGLFALLPIGAVLGSLFKSVQNLGFVTLLISVLVAISGAFYPITALPQWLQLIGQAFPIYWLGLGLRAALLPDALAVAEIGASWRTLETIGALTVWSIVGLTLAPTVLRKMARRT